MRYTIDDSVGRIRHSALGCDVQLVQAQLLEQVQSHEARHHRAVGHVRVPARVRTRRGSRPARGPLRRRRPPAPTGPRLRVVRAARQRGATCTRCAQATATAGASMSTVEAVSLAALSSTSVGPNAPATDVAAGTGPAPAAVAARRTRASTCMGCSGAACWSARRDVRGYTRGRTGLSRMVACRPPGALPRSSSGTLCETAAALSVSRVHTCLHRHAHHNSRAGGDGRRRRRRRCAPLRACALPVGLEPTVGRGDDGAGRRARERAHLASAVKCYSSTRAPLRCALHLMTGGDESASEMARVETCPCAGETEVGRRKGTS
jgi:hypothetical protein